MDKPDGTYRERHWVEVYDKALDQQRALIGKLDVRVDALEKKMKRTLPRTGFWDAMSGVGRWLRNAVPVGAAGLVVVVAIVGLVSWHRSCVQDSYNQCKRACATKDMRVFDYDVASDHSCWCFDDDGRFGHYADSYREWEWTDYPKGNAEDAR